MCKTSVVSVVIITIVKILKSEKLDLVLIPIFEKGLILTKLLARVSTQKNI